jgi:hypothetical protein
MPSRTIEESHRPRVSNRTMRCHSSSGQPSGLLFQKTNGAATTRIWNHREEEAFLRFTHGGKRNRTLGLRKTTLGVGGYVQTFGLNAETKKGSAPTRRGAVSLDIPFYRTCPSEAVVGLAGDGPVSEWRGLAVTFACSSSMEIDSLIIRSRFRALNSDFQLPAATETLGGLAQARGLLGKS